MLEDTFIMTDFPKENFFFDWGGGGEKSGSLPPPSLVAPLDTLLHTGHIQLRIEYCSDISLRHALYNPFNRLRYRFQPLSC